MKNKTFKNFAFAITAHLLIASLTTVPTIEEPLQPKGHKDPVIEIVSIDFYI